MNSSIRYDNCDVAIIGAGPAGLAAAIALKKKGIERVLVLDREGEAGGIPRHCGHPPFGIVEYARVMSGPSYAKRLVKTAQQAGVDIRLQISVTNLGQNGSLSLATPAGTIDLKAKRVLIATGVRETPRAERLVSGGRVLGIATTGSLQSMVYLKNMIPFRNPIIVGTEIVSFSALLTCKKAGIKTIAMLEENKRPTVPWPIHHSTRLLGVPLLLNTQIINIIGSKRVEAVQILDRRQKIREIICDGIIFSGKFTPESTLIRMSHLSIDPETNSPIIDNFGRCSDPAYYAAGNLLQPLNMAVNCWREGRKTADWIAKDLNDAP